MNPCESYCILASSLSIQALKLPFLFQLWEIGGRFQVRSVTLKFLIIFIHHHYHYLHHVLPPSESYHFYSILLAFVSEIEYVAFDLAIARSRRASFESCSASRYSHLVQHSGHWIPEIEALALHQ